MADVDATDFLQYLDDMGEPQLAETAQVSTDLLVDLYQQMVLTRVFDDKAVRLQRTGKMGTYPSSLGQEAVAVGTGRAMTADDIYCPYYRDQGTMICRGVTLEEILRYWSGDERGSDYQGPKEDFPISIPIASQLLHAAGAAYAIKLRKQPRVVVAMCGDGATSEGDFYEALNLASTWQLPVVFVINNNQWAISVPRDKQTATPTLAQKALSASMPGVQVDGNDVSAVYECVGYGVERARQGYGPQLIECLTYRLSDHTTADDAKRYCPQEALDQAWQREPVGRLKRYLCHIGAWDEESDAAYQARCAEQVDRAIDTVTTEAKEPAHAMFNSLYDDFPEPMLDQFETVWTIDD